MSGQWRGTKTTRTATASWAKTRLRILRRDGRRCYQCGADADQVDHKISVARGGSEDDDNLGAICKPCHDRKTSAEGNAARVAKMGHRKRPPEKHPGLR